ncbi:MAG: hypothetical protein GX826_02960 [Gammaproteobacteria bacterium]|nr:hypothetical protein [Gammaproteobacteria bacterium]
MVDARGCAVCPDGPAPLVPRGGSGAAIAGAGSSASLVKRRQLLLVVSAGGWVVGRLRIDDATCRREKTPVWICFRPGSPSAIRDFDKLRQRVEFFNNLIEAQMPAIRLLKSRMSLE